MKRTNRSQSLEEREAELCNTAAWLSSWLKSLSEVAQELSVKADKLAAERRALAQSAAAPSLPASANPARRLRFLLRFERVPTTVICKC